MSDASSSRRRCPDARSRSCSGRSWRHGGSDLHLTAGTPPTVRVHGELERLEEYPPLTPRALQGMIYAILPQKLRERFEQELELDMSYSLPGRARFRVNVYQQRDAVGAAFRLIPFEIKRLDDLGPSGGRGRPRPVPAWVRRRDRARPVPGSRRRSPAMVDVVNRERAGHIMTVEDPIEFLHKHKKCIVNQREVGADTHGFGAGPEARPASGPRRHPGRRDA